MRSKSSVTGKKLLLLILTAGLCVPLAPRAQMPGLTPTTGQRADGPNIILVSIDTLRADHLGCFGYDRNTSPNIDKFAGENYLFTNHIVTMAATLPSHASIFTGLYPVSHGVMKNGRRLSGRLITLAEILKEKGYHTAGIISAWTLNSETGISQGFDEYLDNEGKQTPASALLKRAAPWINGHRDDSFFLFLHLFDPHEPYSPPSDFRRWGEAQIDLYDGEIYYADHVLGKIFDELKKAGLYDESLIIVTSDHGESLGRDNYFGHYRNLYDSELHVPLIVHLPESAKTTPRRMDYQTSAVDILPTILKILRLDTGAPSEGMDLFGDGAVSRKHVFALRSHFSSGDDPHFDGLAPLPMHMDDGEMYVARSREWKYILRTRSMDELYHLAVDPGELVNLAGSKDAGSRPPENYPLLIGAWLENAGTAPAGESGSEIGEDTKKKLRSLGYIN